MYDKKVNEEKRSYDRCSLSKYVIVYTEYIWYIKYLHIFCMSVFILDMYAISPLFFF